MNNYARGTPRNYGGSYDPDRPGQKEPEPLHLEEKIDDMLAYGMPLTDDFPRRRRRLADDLKGFMLDMEDAVIELRIAAKKSTLDNLDKALAKLKKFVILAADRKYNGEKYAPPLTMHQREVWSAMNDEIGRMIGGYKKAVAGGRVGKKE